MSFRELRDFTEMMKSLGYHRLISVENFRTPNFELVADVLYWLVQRYDPSADLSDDISTEDARVEFLRSVAQIMATKARVKLNIKQLYKADGYAVKELLKVSSLLYDAMRAETEGEKGKSGGGSDISLGSKLDDLKEARNLATEIVDSGSKLYTLLGGEEELKVSRQRALNFLDSISLNLESNDPHELIERNIREQINIITDNVAELEKMCTDLEQDQKSLKTKIERKQQDLERAEKRFKSLKKVRPAFMEEYESLEHELKGVYEVYLERFRNLQYLESELNKYRMAEMEKKHESDRALKRMQKRLREEELRILRGEQEVDENGIDDDIFDSGKEDLSSDDGISRGRAGASMRRPGAAGRGGRQGGRPNVMGDMEGGSSSDDSDSDGSGSASGSGGFRSGDSDDSQLSFNSGSDGDGFDEDGDDFSEDDFDEGDDADEGDDDFF